MGVYPLLPEGGHTAPYRRKQSCGFLLSPLVFRAWPYLTRLCQQHIILNGFSPRPLAVRLQKVGVGFCPQNAFGCRSRQANISACPTQGWVNALIGDVGLSEKSLAVRTAGRCKIRVFPAVLFVPRRSSETGPNPPSQPRSTSSFAVHGKTAHSGSQSEAGGRPILRLFFVILRLVDIFPSIW